MRAAGAISTRSAISIPTLAFGALPWGRREFVTEWDEFRHLDMERIKRLMSRPVIVDGRNLYNPKAMRELGFAYRGA